MNKAPNQICKLCSIKVNKFNRESDGYMEAYNKLFHFSCIIKYGYQKFSEEVIEYTKENLTDEDINKRLDNACKLIDLSEK